MAEKVKKEKKVREKKPEYPLKAVPVENGEKIDLDGYFYSSKWIDGERKPVKTKKPTKADESLIKKWKEDVDAFEKRQDKVKQAKLDKKAENKVNRTNRIKDKIKELEAKLTPKK